MFRRDDGPTFLGEVARPEGTLLWVANGIGGTLGLGRDAVPSDGATQRTVIGLGTMDALPEAQPAPVGSK